ncbi:MAG TPA: bifunctional diaminohydroxyphosphoribosylaminopyrimidine deaminase/5-amino-6-(5-phosphoribosylamino)uracil reductase RibD [Terriglobales bacterium]|nr:bifunctional diaminohydroxyphosphoribosylaminopyrimidine deaminase/5-amino-6-(5-phosphoribosylamino)uracil reductase RibD [Terriglobales bacterium]
MDCSTNVAFTPQDEALLARAIELAREGVGLSSPNPCVGAVLTDADGNEVASAYHLYKDLKHAEILALEQAGEKSKGTTLYINIEPCSHTGRTGPCAEALITAGVQRVVAAMADPNPQVSGKGFDRLRSAGIVVEIATGDLHERARSLNESFAKFILQRTPLVTLKAGMTLDGKIAPPPGDSSNPSALGAGGASGGWITSAEARAHVQELRHASDAIMVGVGTVIADDPLLTDRTGKVRRRPLLRVILDSRLRLPMESRLVKSADKDVIVFCAFAEENRKRELESRGIVVEQLPLFPVADRFVVGGNPVKADGRPDMKKLAQRLGEMEITSLLIEGGALVNWAALSAGIVDKVFLYYAPKILAGTGSVPFASGEGFRHMSDAAQVKSFNLHRFGEDFAVEGYLHDPYQAPETPHKAAGPAVVYEGV